MLTINYKKRFSHTSLNVKFKTLIHNKWFKSKVKLNQTKAKVASAKTLVPKLNTNCTPEGAVITVF